MSSNERRILYVMVALAALLALFIVLLLAFDVGGSPRAQPIKIAVVSVTPTPTTPPRATLTATSTPQPQGPSVRARLGTPVHAAPDANSAVLAQLASGQNLPVVARTADAAWLLVQFTAPDAPGVVRTGWVAVSTVDVTGDLAGVPVVAAPTATASPSPTPSPTPTRTPTPPPTATRTPTAPATTALPDLQLQDFGIITQGASAGFLRVDIANIGAADLTNTPIEIVGFDQTGAQVLHLTTGPLTIPVGSFQSVTTGYRPTQRTMLTVVINPSGAIKEADAPPGFPDPNNSLTKAVTPP